MKNEWTELRAFSNMQKKRDEKGAALLALIDKMEQEYNAEMKVIIDLVSRLRDQVTSCGKSLTNKGRDLRDEATAWLKENEHG